MLILPRPDGKLELRASPIHSKAMGMLCAVLDPRRRVLELERNGCRGEISLDELESACRPQEIFLPVT